ncbi:hypothetical protein EDB89DRAFT_2242479 [Lactarius sanguifluus]|nr:hypothetical protein EDB89DRAFT_2242479 [Lactarius sanguifluus]
MYVLWHTSGAGVNSGRATFPQTRRFSVSAAFGDAPSSMKTPLLPRRLTDEGFVAPLDYPSSQVDLLTSANLLARACRRVTQAEYSATIFGGNPEEEIYSRFHIERPTRAISWWNIARGDMIKPKKPFNEYSKQTGGTELECRRSYHPFQLGTNSKNNWIKNKAAQASGKHREKAAANLPDNSGNLRTIRMVPNS